MKFSRPLRTRAQHGQAPIIGVLVPDLGEGHYTQAISGIGDQLIQAGYSYFTAHHMHRRGLVEDYTRMLIGRGARGLIAIDTQLERSVAIPAVAVAGRGHSAGVTNVRLDHVRAAELLLIHLHSLGHRDIAFMRGRSLKSDSDERWKNLVATADKLKIAINPRLVVSLDRDMTSPDLGYPVVQKLLATMQRFTAIVALNDISAIGAIRALMDFNLRVPEDVSVIGFGDIKAAAFTLPRLTTISQSLEEMGRVAAQNLLNRIHDIDSPGEEIMISPELVVRESTGTAVGVS